MSRLQKFSELTSLHGPAHFYETKNVAERIIWVILMITACAIAVCQIYGLVKEFQNQAVVTSVSNQIGKDISNQFNFTYCPEDWLDIGRIRDEKVDVLAFIYGLLYIPMVDFYPIRELDLLHCSVSNCSYVQDNEIMYDNTDNDTAIEWTNYPDTELNSTSKYQSNPDVDTDYKLCKQNNGLYTFSYDYLSTIVFNSKLHSKESLEQRLVQLLIAAKVETVQDLVLEYAKHLDVPKGKGLPSSRVIRTGRVCHQTPLQSGRNGKIQFFYHHKGIVDNVEPGYLFTFYGTKDSTISLEEPSAFTMARVRNLEYKFGAAPSESPTELFSNAFERQMYYLAVKKFIRLDTTQNPCNISNNNEVLSLSSTVRLDSCVFEELMEKQETLRKVANFFHSWRSQKIGEPFEPNAATFGRYGLHNEFCISYFFDFTIFGEQREKCSLRGFNCHDTIIEVKHRYTDNWNPKWVQPIIRAIKNKICSLSNPCHFIRQVEFELSDFVIYEESLKMTPVQFVGNAGGLFGLYIGASLITFAHLLIYWVVALCGCGRSGNKTANEEQPT